jgi:hypothetical protein
MSDFLPRRVSAPYDFDIEHDQGHWVARDRGGLTGGIFRTQKDALRFALAETGGDRSHVHLTRRAKAKETGDAPSQIAL